MTLNQYTDSRQKAEESSQIFAIDICEVNQVKPNAKHTIVVNIKGDPDAIFGASVMAPVDGDINLPEEGDLVAVAYSKGGKAFVIGSYYSVQDTVPQHEAGDRQLGTPSSDAHITLKSDGTVDVNGMAMYWPRLESEPNADDLEDGAVWYNTTDDAYRGVQGGVVVDFNTSAGP